MPSTRRRHFSASVRSAALFSADVKATGRMAAFVFTGGFALTGGGSPVTARAFTFCIGRRRLHCCRVSFRKRYTLTRASLRIDSLGSQPGHTFEGLAVQAGTVEGVLQWLSDVEACHTIHTATQATKAGLHIREHVVGAEGDCVTFRDLRSDLLHGRSP